MTDDLPGAANDDRPRDRGHGPGQAFGETRAVDGVDLAVPRGAVYGVLGPNGAGKTTTIRMLATLLRPDAGSARVLGHDVVKDADAVRGLVSLTGQLASVDEDLTGRENLLFLGRLLGFRSAQAGERADELLEAFDLVEAAGKLVKNYSGGMRRRLDIAASIVVTPQLMFLDEPTTGLDPRSRNQVWDIVRALVGQGTTVLLCTQYLDEADQLAGRIAVIDHGKVIAEGPPAQLKASVGRARCTCACSIPRAGPRPSACSRARQLRPCGSSPIRRRCRCRCRTPTPPRTRSPRSRARASASPTSPSASRASTRSSSR